MFDRLLPCHKSRAFLCYFISLVFDILTVKRATESQASRLYSFYDQLYNLLPQPLVLSVPDYLLSLLLYF